ncbi:NAD-dependent epimerase/dehydratase family protein [Pedobacter sp. LMG 31464]|uniref:NAD-dependent epimerase/dehydratase family protein n=1 Tax=Pedobacter planticolens TaxID=2679964 RepID=A0A923IX45_9SPHI|nr:SDR family oxidoreductase [Pedobacter planticolens]MBB2145917.1 NAD-dependent epimerase/dehydratase family protein [Pedobacter planticolens]
MKILLTGAGGFTGGVLLNTLLKHGHELITLCRKAPIHKKTGVTYKETDIKNIYDVLGTNINIDAILHVAASVNFDTSWDGITQITSDNILSTQILANFAADVNVKKFILSSTCSVYEKNKGIIDEESPVRPLNYYAVSKLSAEWLAYSILKNKVPEFGILRYSSIYGDGQRSNTILPIFVDKAIKNSNIKIFGSGNRIQDYVHVEDVASANLLCLENKIGFADCYNIGSGDAVSDIQLAKTIIANWGSNSMIEILNLNQNEEIGFNFSIEKARKNLGYSPSSLVQGLRNY